MKTLALLFPLAAIVFPNAPAQEPQAETRYSNVALQCVGRTTEGDPVGVDVNTATRTQDETENQTTDRSVLAIVSLNGWISSTVYVSEVFGPNGPNDNESIVRGVAQNKDELELRFNPETNQAQLTLTGDTAGQVVLQCEAP